MKTALQEFIDNVIPMHIIELDMIKQEIKKALEKEKEQIIETFDNGIYVGTYAVDKDGEDYYNQTYNQNELPKTYINGVEVDSDNSSVTTTGVWTPKTNNL